MQQKKTRRYTASAAALLLAAVLLFQDLHPLLDLVANVVDGIQVWVDMALPDGWDSLADLGIFGDDGENNENVDDNWDNTYYGQEPEDYYSEDEELELLGVTKENLVHFDEESRTYVTGENEYVTIFGGDTGTYVDENGVVRLVDNTLEAIKSKRSGSMLKGYTNKANSYKVVFPQKLTAEEGVSVTKGDYKVEVIPISGDYSHSVVKDNAIIYHDVYENISVQYTAITNSVKEDIILLKKSEQTSFQYEIKAPGMVAELIDNQLYIYPEGKTIEDVVYTMPSDSSFP